MCARRFPAIGRTGSWKKWHKGDFQEPGLGGRETPVLSLQESARDAWGPNVVFVPECRRYVMVFQCPGHADLKDAAKPAGGIRLAHSTDGIHWSKPTTLVTAVGIPLARAGNVRFTRPLSSLMHQMRSSRVLPLRLQPEMGGMPRPGAASPCQSYRAAQGGFQLTAGKKGRYRW